MGRSKEIFRIPNILRRNVLTGHDSPVEAIIVREKYIFSASRFGKIIIWDLHTGEIIKSLEGHTSSVNCLDFQKGQLISGSNDKTIRIWSCDSGECIKILHGHTAAILSVSIQDNYIASGSDDSTIKIWKLDSGELIQTIEAHSRSVSGVKFCEDKLFTVSWDHFLKIWDINSWQCVGSYEEHFDAIAAMDVSSKFIVTGDQTGYFNVWDSKTYELLHHLKHHRLSVMGIKIDGNYLYSTSKDKTILITDLSTGVMVKKLEGHQDATVGIDKLGNLVVTSSADKTISIWDDFSLHSQYRIKAHDGLILGTKAQNNTLVTASIDNLLKIWNVKKGELIKTIALEENSWVWGLAFSNNQILASSDEGVYRLYDLNTGQKLLELKGHEGKVYRAMMRNNKAITSGWDTTSRVWDLTTGECLHVLRGHTYAVYSSVITEDGMYVTGSSDGTIRVWDSDGHLKHIINYHQDEVFHLETQGNLVASASGDGICGVFNYKTGETIAEFDDHTDQVWCVLIHNDIVISGSADNSIKVWSLKTKECLDTLEGHTDNVKDLALSGNFLISGSLDSIIRIWDISKYFDEKLEIDETITQDFDVLGAQIQMARTYDLVPAELGSPGIIRILYGMKPLSPDTSCDHEKFVLVLKKSAKTWYNLGKLGYAPWLSDIPRGIEGGTIPIGETETLGIVLEEFMKGFRDNGDLFWMGLLRRFGNKIETLLPEKWSFDLNFSGQGPNPIEGYKWHHLGPRINEVELKDREETALIFQLRLKNINEWILPLVKAFEIQVKDDRGDVDYINFSNFRPDKDGNWCSTAMFKIDAGYKMEPKAIIFFTDVNVIYESLLAPSFQGTNILKQLSLLRHDNEDLRVKVDTIQQQFLLLSEKISTTNTSKIVPKKKNDLVPKTILPGYQLQNLYTCPKGKKIFKRIEKQYQEPAIGTLNVNIGGYFNKFLEHIQPKFILFTSASSITAALIIILLYIQGIFQINFLGTSIEIAGNEIQWAEIILNLLIYFVLIFVLVISISNWIRFQHKKKKRRSFN
ncbi:hypothetical protein NEF87_000955 [Candidatus Lokiarchaeum ossiferum]|uniref:WD40 repeat domain-containing protein n=1 Tax=Candidatus Lokiarchaeum ossiferum TaxID=2951803 RepID=A0ABY6HMD0_9ARCH|nr:hypothetical protein NEF87_000955 [Candidatus Lokiarchaeum sp. B-35]